MATRPEFPSDYDQSLSQAEQIALLWQQFNETFGSDEECMERLIEMASAMDILKCLHCRETRFERTYGGRVALCTSCGKRKWLTGGTFFDHIRLGRPWLALFWFKEHGVSINPNQFHKLLGVAYATAAAMFKKIDLVVLSQMQGDLCVYSALFREIFSKRSLETPARLRPIAEQEETEKGVNEMDAHEEDCRMVSPDLPSSFEGTADDFVPDRVSCLNDANKSMENLSPVGMDCEGFPPLNELPQTHWNLYQLISNKPIHFDAICQVSGMATGEVSSALMMFELYDMVERAVGDWYVRHGPDRGILTSDSIYLVCSDDTLKLAKEAIIYIRNVFKGISRKYLQLYLAAHWYNCNIERWRQGRLISACLKFGRIPYDVIRTYVTPLTVRIFHPTGDVCQ